MYWCIVVLMLLIFDETYIGYKDKYLCNSCVHLLNMDTKGKEHQGI